MDGTTQIQAYKWLAGKKNKTNKNKLSGSSVKSYHCFEHGITPYCISQSARPSKGTPEEDAEGFVTKSKRALRYIFSLNITDRTATPTQKPGKLLKNPVKCLGASVFLLPRFWDVGGNETNPGVTRSTGRAGELICLVNTVPPPSPPCKFDNLD